MKSDKEIAIYKKSIIDRIKDFFSKFFKKKNEVKIEEPRDEMPIQDIPVDIEIEAEASVPNERKKEIFQIYENVKSGKCQIQDLSMPDLINVMILLNEEKKLYNQ